MHVSYSFINSFNKIWFVCSIVHMYLREDCVFKGEPSFFYIFLSVYLLQTDATLHSGSIIK